MHLAPGLFHWQVKSCLSVGKGLVGKRKEAAYPATGNSQPPQQGTGIKVWKRGNSQQEHNFVPCLKQAAIYFLAVLHCLSNCHVYSFWSKWPSFFSPDFNVPAALCSSVWFQKTLLPIVTHQLPLRWRPQSDTHFPSLSQPDSTQKQVVRSPCSTEV